MEATTTTSTTTPGVPQSLVLTPAGGQIEANWTAPTTTGGSPITGYSVQYKVGTNTTWLDWAHADTSTTATITGLANGTQYNVQVAAKNLIGTGTYTAAVDATPYTTLATPSRPTLTAGIDSLDADWPDVTDATGYIIQWSTGSAFAAGATTEHIIASVTSEYNIPSLAQTTTYYVRVKATTTAAGTSNSAWSSSAIETTISGTLGQVANVTVTQPSTSTLDVDWDDVTAATSYVVQWREYPNGSFGIARQLVATDSEGVVGQLKAGTEYSVRVPGAPGRRHWPVVRRGAGDHRGDGRRRQHHRGGRPRPHHSALGRGLRGLLLHPPMDHHRGDLGR